MQNLHFLEEGGFLWKLSPELGQQMWNLQYSSFKTSGLRFYPDLLDICYVEMGWILQSSKAAMRSWKQSL